MNIAGFSNTNNNSNKKQDLITLLTSGSPLPALLLDSWYERVTSRGVLTLGPKA